MEGPGQGAGRRSGPGARRGGRRPPHLVRLEDATAAASQDPSLRRRFHGGLPPGFARACASPRAHTQFPRPSGSAPSRRLDAASSSHVPPPVRVRPALRPDPAAPPAGAQTRLAPPQHRFLHARAPAPAHPASTGAPSQLRPQRVWAVGPAPCDTNTAIRICCSVGRSLWFELVSDLRPVPLPEPALSRGFAGQIVVTRASASTRCFGSSLRPHGSLCLFLWRRGGGDGAGGRLPPAHLLGPRLEFAGQGQLSGRGQLTGSWSPEGQAAENPWKLARSRRQR